MGMFLSVLIVKNNKEEEVRKLLEKIGNSNQSDLWNLVPEECQYQECDGGVRVILNDMCAGYEEIPQNLSKELMNPVMLCYIYDGDFWGYFFYDKGIELDVFNPMPDYFEEVSEEERQRLSGNSKVISQYFNIEEAKIKNYLQTWSEDIFDSEGKHAYVNDESCIGEDWQMADFMRAIGYPY